MTRPQQPGRGGARKGAGRPKGSTTAPPTVTVSSRVAVATVEALDAEAARTGEARSGVAARVLDKWAARG